jgi:hypothetical protein
MEGVALVRQGADQLLKLAAGRQKGGRVFEASSPMSLFCSLPPSPLEPHALLPQLGHKGLPGVSL